MNKKTTIIWIIAVAVVIIAIIAWPKKAATPPDLDLSSVSATSSVISDETTTEAAVVTKPSTMVVKAFFGDTKEDPNSLECGKVYPVYRVITRTPAVGRAALGELLAGPSATEQAQGFTTSLNQGVVLQSLKIENGVAKADFNSKLDEAVGGSCRVAAIRAQITETLKQFPTVKSVVISENGESAEILQP